jgi:hypothetical protein
MDNVFLPFTRLPVVDKPEINCTTRQTFII